jgi:hypothetical protein
MLHQPTQHVALRPLTVKPRVARELLGGIGQTLYDELVRDGKIKVVVIGQTKMPTYESLIALIEGT